MQGVWSDVHTRLIGYICDEIDTQLPGDLVARAEEGVALAALDAHESRARADVAVVENEAWKRGITPQWEPEPTKPEKLSRPILVRTPLPTPRWVEIRSVSGHLVTVIEVTSLSNKTAHGRSLTEQRTARLIAAGVHTVEIDLIRGGIGARDVREGNWPKEPCQISLIRAYESSLTEVYPCPLRQPLPVFAVPLRRQDPDLVLDLQPLIDRCHRRGRYALLDYQADPPGPLSSEDLLWAREILAGAEK